uniref:Uncharacterized protein n=1 Tax=Rhodotorula toruloides TaxID=5286 RepID=A0A0K3CSF2_RHOTO
MPLRCSGPHARYTDRASESTTLPEGMGNLVKLCLSVIHQIALITSLPFVHTARRYYRLNGLVRPPDWLSGAREST